MFSLTELRQELAEQGVSIAAGELPKGVTRNANGEAILYYAGSDLLPEYLMNVDTLIGVPFMGQFAERKEGVEYFDSFEWDVTEAGFVDITRRDKEVVRHYLTTHQPTEVSTLPQGDVRKNWWFRKIYATLPNNVQVKVWERFERTPENMRTGY